MNTSSKPSDTAQFPIPNLLVIGLVGGVASGKSLVGRLFAELGAGVLDADCAGHKALRQPEIEAAAHQRWGGAIFGPDGRIDRGRLARIVFAPTPQGRQEREYLEQLTHPAIGRLIQQQAEALAAAGVRVAVLDAALIFEAGWDKLCEKLVFVDVPRETRLARARLRGWSPAEFDAREAAQAPLESKRPRADAVLENSGSVEQTRAQVQQIWQSLVG